MTIMNRRNAVVGWATWTVFKQVLKRSAKADAAQAEAESKSSRRLRRKDKAAEPQPEQRKKRRGKRRMIGFLAATGIGVGAWLGTRGRKPKGDEVE